MEPAQYHPELLAQLRKTLGDSPELPAGFDSLLQLVSDTYILKTDQLLASTSRAYSFLDSLNMGFIMCDVNGGIVLTNTSAKQILDISKSSLEVIDQLLDPDLKLTDLVRQCLQTSQPQEFHKVSVGKRVINLSLAPLQGEDGQGAKQLLGVVILIEDITEQVVLERSKDEFFSIASHELRTPLTAIRGNASLMQKYYADDIKDKDMAEMIADIHESAIRLIEIVNDFLDVSALEQGKIRMEPSTISLQEISEEVMHELKTLCESKGITLIADASLSQTPTVTADHQRIKQVIYNLIGNAVKFTDHGSITISTESDDNFVYTTVTDTGRGMSAESQKLLFRKFQQAGSSLLTRDTTKGTGLGLYISKLIVELSGGKIGLRSSMEGHGSAFTFTLPRTKT